jgi:hypothetical protein
MTEDKDIRMIGYHAAQQGLNQKCNFVIPQKFAWFADVLCRALLVLLFFVPGVIILGSCLYLLVAKKFAVSYSEYFIALFSCVWIVLGSYFWRILK